MYTFGVHWVAECGGGNQASFLRFKNAFYVRLYNFSHYQLSLKNINHVKFKLFATSASDQDPDRVRVDPHCFGSLDLNPGLKPH